MQPPEAIPPYDEQEIENLIGKWCRVPAIKNPHRGDWCQVTDVRFLSPQMSLVWVVGGRRFGKPRYVRIADVRWKGKKQTDPLIVALIKARAKAKALLSKTPQTSQAPASSPR
jgi:hypothetical protein